MTINELRQEQAALYAAMNKINLKRTEENRENMTAEERAEWDKMDAAYEALGEKIATAERDEKTKLIARDLERVNRPVQAYIPFAKVQPDFNKCFRAWALYGSDQGVPAELAQHAAEAGVNIASNSFSLAPFMKNRAQSKTTDSAFVENERLTAFEKYLAYYAPMRSVAKVFSTSTGNPLPWPKWDDTANTLDIISEAGTIPDNVDPTVDSGVTFYSWKYPSGTLVLSREALRDTAFDVEALSKEAAGERIGRKQSAHFTTGTGSGQPHGIVTAASSGYDNSHATFDPVKIITELEASVDYAYLQDKSQWVLMFHQSTLKKFKQALDGNDRPLWRDGMSGFNELGAPTIDGYRYLVNNNVAEWANDAKAIVFFRSDKYVIRDVGAPVFYRLNELYAATDQVGVGVISYCDARLVNTACAKYLEV